MIGKHSVGKDVEVKERRRMTKWADVDIPVILTNAVKKKMVKVLSTRL
jgi:hypothetical protein